MRKSVYILLFILTLCFCTAYAESNAVFTRSDFELHYGAVSSYAPEAFPPSEARALQFSTIDADASTATYNCKIDSYLEYQLVCNRVSDQILSAKLTWNSLFLRHGFENLKPHTRAYIADLSVKLLATLNPTLDENELKTVNEWFYSVKPLPISESAAFHNTSCSLDVNNESFVFIVNISNENIEVEENLASQTSSEVFVGVFSFDLPECLGLVMQDEHEAVCYFKPFSPGNPLVHITNNYCGAESIASGLAYTEISNFSSRPETKKVIIDGMSAYKHTKETMDGSYRSELIFPGYDNYTNILYFSPQVKKSECEAEFDIILDLIFGDRIER